MSRLPYPAFPSKLYELRRKLSSTAVDVIKKFESRLSLRPDDFRFVTESCESIFQVKNSHLYHQVRAKESHIYSVLIRHVEDEIAHLNDYQAIKKIHLMFKILNNPAVCGNYGIALYVVYGPLRYFSNFQAFVVNRRNLYGVNSVAETQPQQDLFFYIASEKCPFKQSAGQHSMPVQYTKKCYMAFSMIDNRMNLLILGGLWSGETEDNDFGFLPVCSAVKYGTTEAVKSLLQHDFSPRFGPETSLYPKEYSILFTRLFRMHHQAIDNIQTSAHFTEATRMVYTIVAWILEKLLRSGLQKGTDVSSDTAPDEIKRICASFRVIWRAVPYAFVTGSCFAGTARTQQHDPMNMIPDPDDLCELYRIFFPEMSDPPSQPRSLKHQCRCFLRKKLSDNKQLPHGIWQLGLPNILCHYMNLEFD